MHVNEQSHVANERHRSDTSILETHRANLERIITDDVLNIIYKSHIERSSRSINQKYLSPEKLIVSTDSMFDPSGVLSIVVDELVHQARVAGILWEDDQLDFCGVTARVAHLQMMARQLASKLEGTFRHTKHSILLMPCPHETHVFGLQLLDMAFRNAGWAVTKSEAAAEWPGDLLAQAHYDAVGVSLSSQRLLPHLRDAIGRLRRASRNQSLRVLVGGSCFDRGDADIESVGADAYAPDACSAPTIAEEIVNEQKLICAWSAIS